MFLWVSAALCCVCRPYRCLLPPVACFRRKKITGAAGCPFQRKKSSHPAAGCPSQRKKSSHPAAGCPPQRKKASHPAASCPSNEKKRRPRQLAALQSSETVETGRQLLPPAGGA